jgi:multidrug efflux pump subunit AcrA (membrane-fusion protein)
MLRTHSAEGDAGGEHAPLSERVRSLRLSHAPGRDASGGRWLPWTLCVLLAGTTAVFGYLAFARSKADDAPAKPPATDPGEENTHAAASPPEGGIVLESKGHITPARQILVSPKVSGMVVKLPIEEGKRVRKGDVLAQLETDDYQADYDRAAAALEAAKQHRDELQHNRPKEILQAQAELAEAQAQLEQLKDQ